MKRIVQSAKSGKLALDRDKRHKAKLAALVAAGGVTTGAPVAEGEPIQTGLATIAIAESLRDGAGVTS